MITGSALAGRFPLTRFQWRSQGEQYKKRVPYREAAPFRACSFTPLRESVTALPAYEAGHLAGLPVTQGS